MCYLCLQGSNSLFGIPDSSKMNLESKKRRAKEVKDIIKSYEGISCSTVKEHLDKLKEEQYELSKEI